MMGQETTIRIESVRDPFGARLQPGPPVIDLARSMEAEGLRHPITLWADGTLISGSRRLRAAALLGSEPGAPDGNRHIRAVFVDTIEEACKRLLSDNSDEDQLVPMRASEMCALWRMLRHLDAPAAAERLNQARRRGVELRKQTQAGERRPGRSRSRGHGDEYLMNICGEAFGMSESTASRLFAVYSLAHSPIIDPDRRKAAQDAMAILDAGQSSISAQYAALTRGNRPVATTPRATAPVESAPAARQRVAWDRSLPQLEGLLAGLTELGPPNPDLTWDQVGPVRARLAKIRRDLEKIINGMKETAQS